MSSLTPGIPRSLLDLRRAERDAAGAAGRLTTGKRIESPKDGPDAWAEASRARSSFSSLDAIRTSLNETALTVRLADSAMEAVDKFIGQLKHQLEEARQAEPGPARDGFTANYNEIRRQIDSLIENTPDPGARKLLADPALHPEAGDIRVPADVEGTQRIIHAREIHTGATGLNIPELPVPATAEDMEAATEAVAAAATALSQKRSALAGEASGIGRSQEYADRIAALTSAYAESIEASDMNEDGAELLASQLRHALIVESIGRSDEVRSALLQLLG